MGGIGGIGSGGMGGIGTGTVIREGTGGFTQMSQSRG